MKMLTLYYDYILLVSNSRIFYYIEYSTTVKYSAIFAEYFTVVGLLEKAR